MISSKFSFDVDESGEIASYSGTYTRPSGLRYAQRCAAEALLESGDVVGRYTIFLDYVSACLTSVVRNGEQYILPVEAEKRTDAIDALGFGFVTGLIKDMHKTAQPGESQEKKLQP
jgi:hypothetical protein